MSKMDWIPVTERKPRAGVWVLVWTGKYHWIAQISPMFGSWVAVYENEYWSEPTHWMPLPTRPRKKIRADG